MIKIYVANLAKYNEGILKGAWIELPTVAPELDEQLANILGQDEEVAIHDYEAPFTINEYDNIYRLNEIAEILEDTHEDDSIIEAILSNFSDVEEGLQVIEDGDFMVYNDCKDMGEVAMDYLEQTGMLDDVSDLLQSYFDYDAYGRDMEIEGTFIQADYNTFVQIMR